VNVSAADWTSVADAAQAALDDLAVVVRDISKVVRERVPEYRLVSEEQLHAAVARNVRDLLVALRDRRHLLATELADFTVTVEERARNGVPVDDYLLAVSIAEGALWDEVCRRAVKMSDSQRAEAIAIRLTCMNLVTRTTASAHRRIELAYARQDQERRAQAVRMLLRGGLSSDEAHEQLARLGLSAEDTYFVVIARSRSGVDIARILAGDGSAYVLFAEDTVGLSRVRPAVTTDVTVGIAGPAAVADLPRAHHLARVVFDTAWGLGFEGVSEMASLGVRAAVQASPEVGVELRRRYLEPLSASGSLGDELLITVRTFLEVGSRRDLAATQLHIHQNTVGYRINRFVELTGADLSDLTTLAELYWLFIDRDLRG
jgi:hypothetical protein